MSIKNSTSQNLGIESGQLGFALDVNLNIVFIQIAAILSPEWVSVIALDDMESYPCHVNSIIEVMSVVAA
jgi:hypothetical protein